MKQTTLPGQSTSALSDSDLLALLFLSPFAFPILLGLFPRWGGSVGTWLTEHNVLVAATDSLWVLPGAGAGLDLPRLIATAAIAAALIACAITTAVRMRRHRAYKRLHSGDRL